MCYYNNGLLREIHFNKGKVLPIQNMRVYGKVEIWLHSFLTSALDGSE
jgi:hypothetical protein